MLLHILIHFFIFFKFSKLSTLKEILIHVRGVNKNTNKNAIKVENYIKKGFEFQRIKEIK